MLRHDFLSTCEAWLQDKAVAKLIRNTCSGTQPCVNFIERKNVHCLSKISKLVFDRKPHMTLHIAACSHVQSRAQCRILSRFECVTPIHILQRVLVGITTSIGQGTQNRPRVASIYGQFAQHGQVVP